MNKLILTTDFPSYAYLFIADESFNPREKKDVIFNGKIEKNRVFDIPTRFQNIIIRVRQVDYRPVGMTVKMQKDTKITIPAIKDERHEA